ncbi:MAG: flagellar basal-body rod protein FlgF [Candidatus Scalindua rubra]|uniref:Flagellar hook protein n=1 Tax=Candidatus Scalindua brodae TaxID=237368 RepID=A0A0B0ELE7_9BACT|nr:MAG: flagellar hook protein [Candidatus Scalindua brodae]MBZ0108306.1 flagellar basal-body rod protein FlgF [Candidatus Scalindua rubra]TWU34003.1 Flagellar basal-body rod protein FlgG [Candidatus Brocadiaceae bacterium S225]
MIDEIELASSGLDAYANVQETIARNLANANTVGFKKNMISFKTIMSETNGTETSTIQTNYGIDYSYGNLTYTGNTLNMAIDGDGFFALETAKGIRYTRNGQFQISNTGEVVTDTGAKVLGQAGPIVIPKGGGEIIIDKKGIININGKEIGRLTITNFNDLTKLEPTGDSTFAAPEDSIDNTGEAKFNVAQGYLESSNVSVVTEMVDMITNMRSYEASNNVIKTFSDLMERLISNQNI